MPEVPKTKMTLGEAISYLSIKKGSGKRSLDE